MECGRDKEINFRNYFSEKYLNSDKKDSLELTRWGGERGICKEVVVSRNREEHMQIAGGSSFEEVRG